MNAESARSCRRLQVWTQCLATPHRVFLWPEVSQILEDHCGIARKLQVIRVGGTAWLTEKSSDKAASESSVSTPGLRDTEVVSGRSNVVHWLVSTSLDHASIRGPIRAYFATFNLLRPILDPNDFQQELDEPFLTWRLWDDEMREVLFLLVLALGQMATAGLEGAPIHTHEGLPSGFRGGSFQHRPGNDAFLEAQRRWTRISRQPVLSHMQACLLFAVYHESCADHLGVWSAITSASEIRATLLQIRDFDRVSGSSEMFRRSYWACVLDQGHYESGLDLPASTIASFQEEVPPPSFPEVRLESRVPALYEERYSILLSSYIFAAAISLKRLVDNIRVNMEDCEFPFQNIVNVSLIRSS